MNFKVKFLALALITATLFTSCEGDDVAGVSNTEKAKAIINSIENGNTQPANDYINSTTYKQHNLQGVDGKQGVIDFVKAASASGTKVSIKRVFTDNDLVVLHTEYTNLFGENKAVFDVFKFDANGQAVEHWDNIQTIATANASGHTLLDGATTVTDKTKTEANRTLVANFMNEVLVNHTFTNLANYVAVDYIQHNPQGSDGLASLQGSTSILAQLNYAPKKILAEGNFVLAMSQMEAFGSTMAVYDMWRIENGKLAEHWDIIETIPDASTWANTNGKW